MMSQSTTNPPQTQSQNIEMTCFKAVFNPGNSYTKIAVCGKETLLSDRGLLFNPGIFDGDPFVIDGRSGSRGCAREPWVMSTAGERPITVEGGNGKIDFCLPLFIGEMWDSMAESCEAEIYVLCHDPARMAELVRANMQGVFNVTRGSQRKRIEIKVAAVAREGYGFSSLMSPNGVNLLLDGGGGTVIATRHENGRVPVVGGVTVLDNFGNAGLISFLLANNYNGFLGGTPSRESVRRFLHKPKMCKEYTDALDKYANALAYQIRRTPGILSNVDRVFWVGGMAKNKALTAALKRVGLPGFTTVANPQTADVEGVLLAKFGG